MRGPDRARVGPVRPHPQHLPLARILSVAVTCSFHLVPKRVPNARTHERAHGGVLRAQAHDFSRACLGTMGALPATRHDRHRRAQNSPPVSRTAALHCSHARAPRTACIAITPLCAHGRMPPPCAQATLTTATPTTAVLELTGTVARLVGYSSDGMLVSVAVTSVSLVPTLLSLTARRDLLLSSTPRGLFSPPIVCGGSLARLARALHVACPLSCLQPPRHAGSAANGGAAECCARARLRVCSPRRTLTCFLTCFLTCLAVPEQSRAF